jgi:hypothetical protein
MKNLEINQTIKTKYGSQYNSQRHNQDSHAPPL